MSEVLEKMGELPESLAVGMELYSDLSDRLEPAGTVTDVRNYKSTDTHIHATVEVTGNVHIHDIEMSDWNAQEVSGTEDGNTEVRIVTKKQDVDLESIKGDNRE